MTKELAKELLAARGIDLENEEVEKSIQKETFISPINEYCEQVDEIFAVDVWQNSKVWQKLIVEEEFILPVGTKYIYLGQGSIKFVGTTFYYWLPEYEIVVMLMWYTMEELPNAE